jgi:tripartite-type tricarboxylate transporter receptor subunit TctC
MTFFASNVLLGRPIMTTPGVPADRVAALRRGFDAVMKDAAMLKEAETMGLDVAPVTGERIAALVEAVASTPPEIVQRAERAARME